MSDQTKVRATLRRTTRHSLKRALTGRSSELLQISSRKGNKSASHNEARRQTEYPRLRIIQDPISRLNPEMLYRQIQYVVHEGEWNAQGEEISVGGQLS
ncbi:MAG: hypothetical protein WHX93_08020 [bacterium]